MQTTAGLTMPLRSHNLSRLARGVIRYAPRVAFDGVLALLAYLVALFLRFGGRVPGYYYDWFVVIAPFIAGAYCLSAITFNLYRREWRYASLVDLVHLSASVVLASLILLVADLASDMVIAQREHPMPASAVLLGAAFTHLAFSLSKFASRVRRFLATGLFPRGRIGVVIVGAGQAGQLLAREMLRNQQWDYQPVCFVDDNPKKKGLRIHGVPVVGSSNDIPALVGAYKAEVVALAIPSASASGLRRIVDICQPLSARLLFVPGLGDVLDGQGATISLRELRIEDLLGRAPVVVDLTICRAYVADRTVLVTGAAGSIGSELCRQLLRLGPSRLVLLDNNESGVHDLALELKAEAPSIVIVPCVGSVADRQKVRRVFGWIRPQVVFHAAAYKHVPLMEDFPEEAVGVNVLGTRAVAETSDEFGVERFVLVSTDKAVHPSNVMGATKRMAELVIKDLATRSETTFCAVRFGNVLGSRGSVVPIFTKQIERGGPITITHPDVKRFFMTIPEAVSLVIEAGSFATPGDTFVLEMGEQLKILDLAEKMVRFRGLRLGKDVKIVYTGLRPGEKLAEELVGESETILPTGHPKVMRLNDCAVCPDTQVVLSVLERMLESGSSDAIRAALFDAALREAAPAAALPTLVAPAE